MDEEKNTGKIEDTPVSDEQEDEYLEKLSEDEKKENTEEKDMSDEKDKSGSQKPEEKDSNEVEFTNDPDVDEAVDKIVNEESDKLLEAEDEAKEREFSPPVQKKSLKTKLKNLVIAWWSNKRLRYSTFAGLALLFIIAIFVPFTRYGMLNLAGVRVSSSMVVLDSKTGLPLENIPVKLRNKEARTNEEGYVSFNELKQGPSAVIIEKRGYAKYEKLITLGWGSNRLDNQEILATGAQYVFVLSDWLSKKPVTDEAEASSGEDIARSNEEGRIALTVGDVDGNAEVVVSAKGYRDETFKLTDLLDADNEVKMVPAKKHAFVSNRNGEYDLYKIDVDGKNEEVLLAATGEEREIPFVLPHPTRDVVAYISSRDGDVNKDKFVLDGLFVIDVADSKTYKVARSEQMQIIGWVGNKLVYVAVIEGVSAGNSQRSKLVTYDLDTKEREDIASSNYFNDVKLVNDTLYYAVSSYAVPQSQAKLFSVDIDGENKQTVVDAQVWTIIRESFDTLLFNAIDLQWFEQKNDEPAVKLTTQPASRASRVYSTSPNGEQAIWVDVRDGKGVLLNYDIEAKSDKILLTESGISDPVYWLTNQHIVYRVSTSQETADYILSPATGEFKKIADVIGNRSRYFY